MLQKFWFHGDISAEESQTLLHTSPPGGYLVRFSSTHPGNFTISSLTTKDNSLVHQRVTYVPEKRAFIFNGNEFKTLDDVIRSCDDLVVPCKSSKYQPLFFDTLHKVVGYA